MRIMTWGLYLGIVFSLASYAYSQMTWTPIFVSSEKSQVDFWTQTETGCACSFNSSSKNCACCVLSGGCSCGIAMPKRCAQCGLEKYCTNMCNITLDSKELLRKSNRAFGQIKSPSVEGPTECTYRFIPDVGQRVELQIYRLISIGRHNGKSCEGGWLELEGGARICGSNVRSDPPVVLFSDKSPATLWMKINENTTRSQFLAYFSFASRTSTSVGWPMKGGKAVNSTECDWIFDDCLNTDCILASPSYPGLYPPNIHCHYLIKSDVNVSIVITFNSLLLAYKDFNHCTNDYVAVYAGSTTSSTMLKKLCNNEKITVVHFGSEVLIEFKSGPEIPPFNYNGFFAQVTLIQMTTVPPTTTSISNTIKTVEDTYDKSNHHIKYNRNFNEIYISNTTSGCNLEIDGTILRSGHYDTRGKHKLTNCRFIFRGRPFDTVHILLTGYNLSSPDCKSMIEIWDGNLADGKNENTIKSSKRICSPAQNIRQPRQFQNSERYTESEHYSSTGKEMTIVFKRLDNKSDDEQFMDFSYYFHDEGEGGTLRPSSTCDVEYYGLTSPKQGKLTNPILKFFPVYDSIGCKQHFIPASNQSLILIIDNAFTINSNNQQCETLCGDSGCRCVSDKLLNDINHLKIISEPNHVIICLCGNYQNWLPLRVRSWSPLYIEWFHSSGSNLNLTANYKFIEDTYCGDHSTSQLQGFVRAGDLTNNAITNQYYQQKCTWLLESKIDRQLIIEMESLQDRPCTAWNLTIHEYIISENPIGQRLYTFCSRDRRKNFTLPWRMNTAIIRLQALSRTAPQYIIKWQSITVASSTRKNEPSPAPDFVLNSSVSRFKFYHQTLITSKIWTSIHMIFIMSLFN
ncbi:uncharacterized protein [Chelonus insularis]|uniref:uncharacterized protein n=1 Tax=Chelonus insularis TaxID=460826 RepID=UPI00158A1E40|nr:uncharacterized protein LOC118065839 [Chelonus insularis]XP_034937260.1 uncharacterized protein LOC118065839 [Chelonus insularis]